MSGGGDHRQKHKRRELRCRGAKNGAVRSVVPDPKLSPLSKSPSCGSKKQGMRGRSTDRRGYILHNPIANISKYSAREKQGKRGMYCCRILLVDSSDRARLNGGKCARIGSRTPLRPLARKEELSVNQWVIGSLAT